MHHQVPPGVFLLPIVVFPIAWVLAAFAMSRSGGWTALAERYGTDRPEPPNTRSMQWATFGWLSYKGVIKVGYSDDGLYLGMMTLFRMFHPPLLIPWSAIRSRTRGRYWMMSVDTLEVGDIRIRLKTQVTDSFVRHLPAAQ